MLYAYFHYCIKSSFLWNSKRNIWGKDLSIYKNILEISEQLFLRIKKLKLKIGVSAQVEYILLAWKYEMLVFFTSTYNFTS